MPNIAAFIDQLRVVFGRELVDLSIKRGMKGEAGWFHATESGHEVGTPFEIRAGLAVSSMQIETATSELHGSGALSRRRSR